MHGFMRISYPGNWSGERDYRATPFVVLLSLPPRYLRGWELGKGGQGMSRNKLYYMLSLLSRCLQSEPWSQDGVQSGLLRGY